MNKSLIANVTAVLIIVTGYFSPIYGNVIMMTGVFALSGSVTNWIAIYMLFEKVPLLYGSGVIPNRFEDFKIGIKNLIIEEFFNKKHIEQFFKQNNQSLSADAINSEIDFDKIFEGLVDAIMESSMGSMLAMFGGREALDPLKESIIEKLKGIVKEFSENKDSKSEDGYAQKIIVKIEEIIDNRLAELTPQMVKDIIQKMIKEHLGWLVVWGGVFGGLIGLGFGLVF